MTDDIFYATFHFEEPTMGASFGIYLKQNADNAAERLDCFRLALALQDGWNAAIRQMLSDDFYFTTVRARWLGGDGSTQQSAPYQAKSPDTEQVGVQSGPGLPSNNSVVIGLTQNAYPARHNGRLFVPGIPEVATNGSVLTAAALVPYQDFAAFLTAPVAAVNDTGTWEVGVMNHTIANNVPQDDPKDWVGGFTPLVATQVNSLIGKIRKRRTRARGAAQA